MCCQCNRFEEDCICLAIKAESGPAWEFGDVADQLVRLHQHSCEGCRHRGHAGHCYDPGCRCLGYRYVPVVEIRSVA